MSEPHQPLDRTVLPSEEAETNLFPSALSDLCDRFKQAWQAEASPALEDYLREVPSDHAAEAFLALLLIEIKLRQQRGQAVVREEYLQKYPAYRDSIDRAFSWQPPVIPGQIPLALHTVKPHAQSPIENSMETHAFSTDWSKLREHFEALCKSDSSPSLEIYLAEVPPAEIPSRLEELLHLDIAYRKQRGEAVGIDTYASRFPNHIAVIRRVFSSQSDAQRESNAAPSASQLSDSQELLDPTLIPEVRPTETSQTCFREKHFHAGGGMGDVYLAYDEILRRDIALKRLKKDKVGRLEVQARFQREAKITGFLEHPGIVPIYHYGISSDGRPYYLMRFIEGDSFHDLLKNYFHSRPNPELNRFNLELRRFLMILVDVCHTMHFAHGKRVIHRDLKPQNIMIGRAGETLVVDWGMAKIISGQDAEEQHDLHPILPLGEDQLTQDGAIQGTLPYMSPEQARGALTLGPATDIFALGAILFQVLTGKHPYYEADSKSVSYPRVMEGKYTPLVSLRPDIPAALAAMVDKALEKNPSDRYRHAKDLADDIQLWLADEQVSVHVDTKYESLTRWMRRNDFRVITSIGALLLVALTAVTAFVLVNSARRAEEKQRIIAEQALAKSVQYFQQEREAVETWLTTAAEVMRYYPGVQKAREQMLTKAAEHYERSVEQATSDNRLELERARNYLRLGDVYVLRRQDHEAEKAYEFGEELFAKLSQAIPALDTQSGWAECRMRRAMLQAELGQMAAARELLVETRRMLTGEDDKSLEMRAFCFANEGKLRLDSREYDTARQLLSNAETDFEKLAVQQPEHVKYRQALAGVMNRHGQVLVALGLLEEGKGKLVQACSKFESLARSAPDDPAPLEQLSHTRIALATVFRALGQREEESQQYAAALRDYERLNQALPDVPIYLESIGLTLVDHAQLLVEMGEYPQALEHLDRALDLFTRLRENFSQFPRYQEEFATSADAKGDLLRDQNKLAEAEDWLKQAISGLESLTKNYADIPAYWERLAISRLRLAQVFEMRMQDASAIAQYRQALEDLGQVKSLVESVQNSQAIIHWYLGEALLRTAEKAEAQRELSAARDLWEQLALSSPSPETIAYRVRFMTHCMEPSFRAMPVALKQAKHITSTTPNNADYWLLQAQVQYRSQQTAEGLEALKKAMVLREKPQARDLITQALLQLQAKEDAAAQKSFAEGEKLHAQQHPGRRDARILLEEAQALLTPPSDTTQAP